MTGVRHNGGRSNRVLVTGGCGFIGCNLAAALAASGRDVLVFDNFSRAGAQINGEWLRRRHGHRIVIKVGDVRDAAAVREAVAQADAVLHLAGQVAVTTSLDDPVTDFDINARGTLNVIEAVRHMNPLAPLVFASTNKVYGKLFDEAEIDEKGDRCAPKDARFAYGVREDTSLDLYSPYGCSKGTADQYVHDYARVFGLRFAVLRMSCIYGPRQFGNEDQGWLAHFMLQAMRGQPITIYGDGRQVRDALFIDDAVAAWIAALERVDEIAGCVFNLGGGPANTVSLRELIALIARMLDKDPEIQFAPPRPGDQPWYVSDIGAIGKALGWRPHVTLREGLDALEGWLLNLAAPPATREPALEAQL